MEASWLAAEAAARDGHLSGRRVRIVHMKSRTDLLNRTGQAMVRHVNGTDVRYKVVLDDNYGTITTAVRNLERADVPPMRYGGRKAGLRFIDGDELALVLGHVLFRAEGFGDADEKELRAAGKLTMSASRFAALSSVSVGWFNAGMACASTKLASLGSASITIVEAEALVNPRLKGRALMMRRIASAAAPKPVPKPKPDPFAARRRVSPESGVHVMTGDANTWHFRRADERPEEARARAANERETRDAAFVKPAWVPRA